MDELRIFEWDEDKNLSNIEKHKIAFEDAVLIFNDPERIELYDSLHSASSEDRIKVIGKVHKVLVVIYTERHVATRIISARYAEKAEKEVYYGNKDL
jgi:uncharacterized protein